MSLLTSVNAGSASVDYFIENIGGPGNSAADAPCIKGSTLGAILVGNPAAGVIIRGDTIANNNRIGGGQVAGGQFQIGNSTTSFQNIVLTDGITTVNGTLAVAGAGDLIIGDDISLGGDLTFTNGATGASIVGMYANTMPVVGAGPVANPPGLTEGLYSVILVPAAGNELAQPSGIFYRTATTWFGNAVSVAFSLGPAPNCVINPIVGGATLEVTGAGTPAGLLVFRKLRSD